jgi:hypothetical protein
MRFTALKGPCRPNSHTNNSLQRKSPRDPNIFWNPVTGPYRESSRRPHPHQELGWARFRPRVFVGSKNTFFIGPWQLPTALAAWAW